MMQTEFQREEGRNYFVLFGTAETREDYQFQMLADNRLDCFAPISIRMQDQQVCIFYDISSRQPLKRLYERKKITQKEIVPFFQHLRKVFQVAETYLLDLDRIMLEPENIYVDPAKEKLYFCLDFPRDKTVEESFRELLRFFLDRISYEDYICVGLVYGLYQESVQENVTVQNLLELMGQAENRQVMYWENEDRKQTTLPCNKDTADSDIRFSGGVQTEVYRDIPESKKDKSTWYKGLKRFWEQLLGKGEKELPRVQQTQQSYQIQQVWPCSNSPTNKQISEVIISEEFTTQTLCESAEPEVMRQYRLRSKWPGRYEDIIITFFPFIIGTLPEATDYTALNPKISRLHARLERKGDKIIITDLNSTNGTFVNDSILLATEEKEIHFGDRIALADWIYDFQ